MQCASSTEHKDYLFVDIVKILDKQKSILQRDLQELKKSIYSNYQKIASYIPVQKRGLIENSEKIATAINKHGEDVHREINEIKKLRSDLDEIDNRHLAVLNIKPEDEIKQTISEITRNNC